MSVATYASLTPGLKFKPLESSTSAERVRRYLAAAGLPQDFAPYRGIVPPLLLNCVNELRTSLPGTIPDGVLATRDEMQIRGLVAPDTRVVADISVSNRYEKRGRKYVEFLQVMKDEKGRVLLRSKKTWLWTE